MIPVIVAAIAGAGGALAGYIARKAREAEARRQALGGPAGSGQQAPEGKAFLFKWLGDFLRVLVSPVKPDPGGAPAAEPAAAPPPPPAPAPPSGSLRLARVINLLDRPLFYGGFLLVAWLLVDLGLAYALAAADYAAIQRLAGPIVLVLGPATVGYWTNWLAIKMLFRPRQPNAVWHGLIPARRQELVEKMADTIIQELISPGIVREYLHKSGMVRELTGRIVAASRAVLDDPDFRAQLKQIIYERVRAEVESPQTRQWVREYIERKIAQWTDRTLAGKLLRPSQKYWEPILQNLAQELLPRQALKAMDLVFDRLDTQLDRLPDWIRQQSERIEEAAQSAIEAALASFDVKKILLEQLAKKDEAHLEEMLTGNVAREIVFIQTSGGLLGMLVGLAILWPPLRGAMVAFGLALWLTYRRTVRPAVAS